MPDADRGAVGANTLRAVPSEGLLGRANAIQKDVDGQQSVAHSRRARSASRWITAAAASARYTERSRPMARWSPLRRPVRTGCPLRLEAHEGRDL